ncbi:MAG: hypothetical protein AAGJ29_02045 [Pseudomonadota bacterium]
MVVKALRALFAIGPLIFAAGFLWPLLAQLLIESGWSMPAGISPLVTAGITAALLGIIAQVRGSWLWLTR